MSLRLTSVVLFWVLILYSLLDLCVHKPNMRTLILIFFLMLLQTRLQKHRLINKSFFGSVAGICILLINIHSLRCSEVFMFSINNYIIIETRLIDLNQMIVRLFNLSDCDIITES